MISSVTRQRRTETLGFIDIVNFMDKLQKLHDMSQCNEWSVHGMRLNSGLEIFLRRFYMDGKELSDPQPECGLHFDRIASWAIIDMSMVRQYYGEDEADNPPVVQELPYDGDRTFVEGFTVNTEAHGNAWKHFRITTTSEIIDVISAELPVISWSCPTHCQRYD